MKLKLTEMTYDQIMAMTDATEFYDKLADFMLEMGSTQDKETLIKVMQQGTLEQAKEKFKLSLQILEQIADEGL